MGDPTEPMDDSDRLKPCPFCGGHAEIVQRSKSDRWGGTEVFHAVECVSCDANNWDYTETEAAAAWNRRAPTVTARHD